MTNMRVEKRARSQTGQEETQAARFFYVHLLLLLFFFFIIIIFLHHLLETPARSCYLGGLYAFPARCPACKADPARKDRAETSHVSDKAVAMLAQSGHLAHEDAKRVVKLQQGRQTLLVDQVAVSERRPTRQDATGCEAMRKGVAVNTQTHTHAHTHEYTHRQPEHTHAKTDTHTQTHARAQT
jgi:hypothetical protein